MNCAAALVKFSVCVDDVSWIGLRFRLVHAPAHCVHDEPKCLILVHWIDGSRFRDLDPHRIHSNDLFWPSSIQREEGNGYIDCLPGKLRQYRLVALVEIVKRLLRYPNHALSVDQEHAVSKCDV